MPMLSKKAFVLPSKKSTKSTFKLPKNYKENISKLLNNNAVETSTALPQYDAKKKKTSLEKRLSLTISFESKSEVESLNITNTSIATQNDTLNSSSQPEDSDADSILTKEFLNRKDIKEKYFEFWNANLTPEIDDFKSLFQEKETKIVRKNKPNNKKRKILQSPESKAKKKTVNNKNEKTNKPQKTSKKNKKECKTNENISKEKVPEEDLYEKMLLIQESRNVGLYVLCDACDKHRYLHDIKDPLDLPDKWFCWMNSDTKHNTCEAEEIIIDKQEEEFIIYNLYNAGSIVWAKMDGYPWWPAMVEDDPDVEDYFWLEDSLEPTYYHVSFFDSSEVTRAWIKTADLKPFKKNSNVNSGIRLSMFKKRIDAAVEQAKDALKLQLIERLKKYSFIHRYKKPLKKISSVHSNIKRRADSKEKNRNDPAGKPLKRTHDCDKQLKVRKRKSVKIMESSDESIQNESISEILENNINFQNDTEINLEYF